ncbi:MAG: TRAP transporter large permease subunit [Thermodesulfobacteriota bacterium]
MFKVLVFLRVHITFCLAISPIITGLYLHIFLEAILKVIADVLMNFSLLLILFFYYYGRDYERRGGISRRMVNLANLFIGKLPGGLALINVLDSMFFR